MLHLRLHGLTGRAGTPSEVFQRPADEFVARFVGCENIIEGHVGVAQDGSVFTTGSLRPAVDPAHHRPMHIVIRLECLRLAPEVANGFENTLPARVVRVVDKGPLLKAHVAAAEHEWAVLLSAHEAREVGVETGSELAMAAPREHAHIIPA